jgi:ADP-ribose pyrophosphatase YjhB (NUDIX family)
MKQAVRAIVIRGDLKNGELLTMHRNKFGQQYYTLVGGGVELHENLEQALLRELAEETGVQVANPRLMYIEEADRLYGTQYVYLCEYVSGEPTLAADSEEAKINLLGDNLYQPVWLPLEKLQEATFVSLGLKERILIARDQGWPRQVEEFSHIQAIL